MDIYEDLRSLKYYSPAHTQIEVKGMLDKNLSEYLGGLKINWRTDKNKIKISHLEGEISDQTSLIGVLNTLYNMRFPIISVKLRTQKTKNEK